MALFASSSSHKSRNLVEYRAGKMSKLSDNMVHADARKGQIFINMGEDHKLHFCWRDRTTDKVEDDVTIKAGDAEFKHLAQVKTGRVYVLRLKGDAPQRFYFYWMQEPKIEKDDDFVKKVNEYLKKPPTTGGRGERDLARMSGLETSDLASMLGSFDPHFLTNIMGGEGGASLTSLLGGVNDWHSPPSSVGGEADARADGASSVEGLGNSTWAPARGRAALRSSAHQDLRIPSSLAADSASSGPPSTAPNGSRGHGPPIVELSHVQTILQNIGSQAATSSSSSSRAGATAAMDLAEVLKPNQLLPFLASADVQRQLIPLLPQTSQSGDATHQVAGGLDLPTDVEELRTTMHTPQFRQALNLFSEALATGQLTSALRQFDLPAPCMEAAARGDVEGFVLALQTTAGPSNIRLNAAASLALPSQGTLWSTSTQSTESTTAASSSSTHAPEKMEQDDDDDAQ